MTDVLLILNAGSSSLKFSVFRDSDPPEMLLRGQLEGLLTSPRFSARNAAGKSLGERTWPEGPLGHAGAIDFLFDWSHNQLGQSAGNPTEGTVPAIGVTATAGQSGVLRIKAVGHRVVHGGTRFTRPVRVDAEVLSELESQIPLAPLHQPHNVAAMKAVQARLPDIPQIACFDTSFHRTQPVVAQQFALPQELSASGIQRYGFHGLSYEYVIGKLSQLDSEAAAGRVIIAHLGNGASLCAVRNQSSVATTMGFTPLDGLVMGTRCGTIDPGVLIYLMDQGMDARAIEKLLYHQSGLLGISGKSSDMRELLAQAAKDPRCRAAIDLFVYRIVREIGSLTAALGGLDALVFTGGIGEHSPDIRGRVCRDLNWLGVDFDECANERHDKRVSPPMSRVAAWVIPTDEELMIAMHMQNLFS